MVVIPSEELVDLELLNSKLLKFLEQPLYDISELKKEMIPEATGIYAFYEMRPDRAQPQIMYVGTVTQTTPRPRISTGLRFRIWENHCGTRGEDNFRSDVRELRRLDSLQDTKQYFRNKCSCLWMETEDIEMLRRLEHFAIALLNPPFND